MMGTCTSIREKLGAFVDGELLPAERPGVAKHLAACQFCAGEVETLRGLGDLLRTAAFEMPVHRGLDSLAARVVSRRRAESATSWIALWERASADWRWMIVGSGSLVATLASTLMVVGLLSFGPNPWRQDSLAALIGNFGSPQFMGSSASSAGMMFAYAVPPEALEEAQRLPGGDRYGVPAIGVDENDAGIMLAPALADAVMSGGRVATLDNLVPARRKAADKLMKQISDQWAANEAPAQLYLMTSAVVNAKGL